MPLSLSSSPNSSPSTARSSTTNSQSCATSAAKTACCHANNTAFWQTPKISAVVGPSRWSIPSMASWSEQASLALRKCSTSFNDLHKLSGESLRKHGLPFSHWWENQIKKGPMSLPSHKLKPKTRKAASPSHSCCSLNDFLTQSLSSLSLSLHHKMTIFSMGVFLAILNEIYKI